MAGLVTGKEGTSLHTDVPERVRNAGFQAVDLSCEALSGFGAWLSASIGGYSWSWSGRHV